MTFTNHIQSGVDATLAGYVGNGVTVLSAGGNFTVYDKHATTLQVNGTLTINPETEKILSTSAIGIQINSGGHLIIIAVGEAI